MFSPSDRRGFLRGLVSLPLIGGGVTLVGSPTAAAVPVTDALKHEYLQWLSYERHRAAIELQGAAFAHRHSTVFHGPAYEWHCQVNQPGPFSRAAIVMSAVGCGWERS